MEEKSKKKKATTQKGTQTWIHRTGRDPGVETEASSAAGYIALTRLLLPPYRGPPHQHHHCRLVSRWHCPVRVGCDLRLRHLRC